MENETLNIFDAERKHIGVATREEVHEVGHWHETFHCWFLCTKDEIDYIYFQIRSEIKKDYPNLLDITAAGHMLANETIYDGLREVEEELGIHISFNDLISLGIIKNCIITDTIIDKEFSHVFLYKMNEPSIEYALQKEEVSGIVRAEFHSFHEFCLGDKTEISIEGFKINPDGSEVSIHKTVNKSSFVPHQKSYLKSVARLIKENIISENQTVEGCSMD